MSVDTVIYALTKVRLHLIKTPESFSPEGHRRVITALEVMRTQLMSEDIVGFNDYIDMILGREPDAADFVLEELFEQLNITHREELSAILLED